MNEKPLPPTPKRLHDARADGNVARSDVLTGFAVALAAAEVGFLCLDANIDRWFELQDAVFQQIQAPDRVSAFAQLLRHALYFGAISLAPIAAICLIATIAAARAIGGLSLAPKAIRPSLKRLNAARRVKELFSAKQFTAVVLALAAAAIVAAVGYWRLREALPVVVAMTAWQSPGFDRETGVASLHLVVRTLIAALLAPALISAVVAVRQHRKGLRMSHRELRDEMKQTSGDPLVRAHQRARSIEAAAATRSPEHGPQHYARRSRKRVLVTNPEHIAVLLDYGGDDAEPPVVIDKGIDDEALNMANSVVLERIPVFRFRRLARHLYRHGELQTAIPADCYRAVAILYRIVEEIEQLDERPSAPIEIDDVVFDE